VPSSPALATSGSTAEIEIILIVKPSKEGNDIAGVIAYKHHQCTRPFINATLKKSFVYFFRDAIFILLLLIVVLVE
jgi:hypothetical protein